MLSKFFKFPKSIFLKHEISAPFSLVEAKTDISNIHIGQASRIHLLQNNFSYFRFPE